MTQDQIRRRRVAVRGTLLAFAALGIAAVGYLIATNRPTPDSWYPKCTLYQMTGLHCPGCGAGRALHFLLNGHVLTAARLNLFALIALPVIGVVAARAAIRWALGRPSPDRKPLQAFWIWLLFVAIMLFWVLRNIPVEPFTFLAPYEI